MRRFLGIVPWGSDWHDIPPDAWWSRYRFPRHRLLDRTRRFVELAVFPFTKFIRYHHPESLAPSGDRPERSERCPER